MADIHEIRRMLMLDVLVPVLGRRAGRWIPDFKHGEVVSEPRAVFVGAAGVALQVPDQHLAVLVDGSRRYLVYQGFHYRDLPQGYYDARCVQVFQQPPTVLEPVTRLSRDGLEVTLRVRLVWRVIDPLAVVDKRSFHQSVYQAGLAVTAAFIRSQPYARLVQTPDGREAMSPVEIGGQLRLALRLKNIFRGVDLLEVIVDPPEGNRDLQEAAQNALVEASLIAAQRQLLDQQTDLEREKLEQRNQLDTRQAQAERRVLAEQQKNRLVQAAVDQRVTEMQRPIRDQELEYREKSNQVELRREGGQMVLEARKQVLLRLVETLTNSLMAPNLLGQVGGMNAGVITQMVHSVLEGLDPAMLMLAPGNGANQPPETDPLKVRLVREVIETQLRLPEMQWQGMAPEKGGEVRVQFAYKGWMIKLYANQDYPRVGPRVVVHRSGARSTAENPANTFRPSWNPRKRLVDLLVYMAQRISSDPRRENGPGDQPFDRPSSVAG